ncbi:MAG: deoxyguanosinetriphosphate triphosphohydrolase, partial [Chloroflexota bacterium]
PLRTAFQRDRDRIIHTKAFRRLMHKTQVFIAPVGDHYVTRLTHTLEVAQIARTISRALSLNEDLTEAIAMGHDLGHAPFGHVGEETLNSLYQRGFRHNEQSLRVVDLLERDGKGLNLTWEVRDGILNHSKPRESFTGTVRAYAGTLEGEVCRLADCIAYVNHDIGDAVRAGLITPSDLPSATITVLGDSHSARINTMICDVVAHSWTVSTGGKGAVPTISMSPAIRIATEELREFLFVRVYNVHSAKEDARRARETLCRLYGYFTRHKLPDDYLSDNGDKEQRIVDYIAGMTDQFALRQAQELPC